MNAQPAEAATLGPYARTFDAYWQAGWRGVLPLPPNRKKNPPDGYTGHAGRDPSYPDVHAWGTGEHTGGNIALRMPANVIGIDVDAYGAKGGAATLAAWVARCGQLPATWRSTSRDDLISCIRLFAVPEGLAWPSELGPGVEIIRRAHRYAVVAPSLHPDTGKAYRWINPSDIIAVNPPDPDTLPALPAAWVEAMTGGEMAVDAVRADLDADAAYDWLTGHTNAAKPPCERTAAALTIGVDAINDATTSTHDAALVAVARLVRHCHEGHSGALGALSQLRAAFVADTTRAGREGARSGGQAGAEWARALRGAINLVAPDPQVDLCDCDGRTPDWIIDLATRERAAFPEQREQPGTEPATVAADGTPGAAIRQQFPALDWHTLWADNSEEEWLLEPLLPARRLVAIYSAPKVGKSLLMLEVAAGIATGTETLGATPKRSNVLYVDFENDPVADIRPRLQGMGYSPDQLGDLSYLSFPSMAKLDSEAGARELLSAALAYDAALIVIDTVSRAVGGDENENDTWLAFYRHTGLALKRHGIALMRLDHSGKDETKGQRGGSAKSGDVDAVWRMSRITDTTYRLECEANRFPISEKTLDLERREDPRLRHVVSVYGREGAFRARIAELVLWLDAVGLADDAGRPASRAALKAAGKTAASDALNAAIATRRARLK